MNPINFNFYTQLIEKETSMAVIGLGYVGLPVALGFAQKVKVIGFDINEERIAMLQRHEDPSKELESSAFEGCNISFTANAEALKNASFFVVTVPTPIDQHNLPDLTPLKKACITVGKALQSGSCVVFESTVYPGCTEEDCIPILEKESGLKAGVDFKYGYSPERINPGDKEHTLATITKVVAGNDVQALNEIAKCYELVALKGVHRASSVKVAEAAKIIENTQRDLNIAFMNELSMIFNRMGINTYEVLEAAGTKWNFLPFRPGLVGGHCIGVDPYYLTHKAKEVGHTARIILSGRAVNDDMPAYVAKQLVQKLLSFKKDIAHCRVLIMGATFKENVSDIRNSKVAVLARELKGYMLHTDLIDPHADSAEFEHEYGFALANMPTGIYDCVILAVTHREYAKWQPADFKKWMPEDHFLFADLKGLFAGKFPANNYWSL